MATQQAPSAAAVGWTAYAAVMMIVLGAFHTMAGLVGIIEDEFYVLTAEYVFKFDATSWGWTHLIFGIIVILAAFGLFSGAVWARTVGVILAVVSTLVNFAWLPWYPFWSIVMIVANGFVIWALTVHGRDIAAND